MDRFEFVPEKGFEDAAAFPDPGSEEATRKQLMELHNQMKTYVNSMADTVTTIEGAVGDPDAIQQIEDAVSQIENFLTVSPYVVYLEEE